jgi:hypothetical protein
MKSGIIICDKRESASVKTVITVLDAMRGLKKEGTIKIVGGKGDFSVVRNKSFELMRAEVNDNVIRGFLIDSDLITNFSTMELMQYMKYADDHNYNFSVPYPIGYGHIDVMDSNCKEIPKSEYDKLKDWDTVYATGLGFYYGDIPLDYTFRSDKFGEDYYFFKDLNLNLRIVKSLKLTHYVTLPLSIKKEGN